MTARLPERDGEFEYRIRSPDEPYERIARESELRGGVSWSDLLGFLYVTGAAAFLAWQRIGLGSPQRLHGLQDRSRTRSTAGRTLIRSCFFIVQCRLRGRLSLVASSFRIQLQIHCDFFRQHSGGLWPYLEHC